MSGRWSGLPDDEIEELARLMMAVVCEEWAEGERPLRSSVVRERLIEEGIEVPDWAMADAFELLKGWLITPRLGGANPHVEGEAAEFRAHGGLMIGAVTTDFCGEA